MFGYNDDTDWWTHVFHNVEKSSKPKVSSLKEVPPTPHPHPSPPEHTHTPIKTVLFCMQSTWFRNFCRTSPYVFQSWYMILNVDEGEGWVWRGVEGREVGTAVHVQKYYTPSCALRSSPQSLLAVAFQADTAVKVCSESTLVEARLFRSRAILPCSVPCNTLKTLGTFSAGWAI